MEISQNQSFENKIGLPPANGEPSSAESHLWAYGDESGIHQGAKYCLIFGQIASDLQWKLFNGLWTAVLDRHGVEEFHSTDFFQPGRLQSSGNPYHGWPKARRLLFLSELLDVAEACTLLPIGGAVDTQAFSNLTQEQRVYFTGGHLDTSFSMKRDKDSGDLKANMRRRFNTTGAPSRPYLMAFNLFLEEVHDLSPPGTVVHVVLDQQTSLEANVIEYFERVWVPLFRPGETRFSSVEFRDSVSEPGLQLADIWAYLVGRQLNGRPSYETSSTLARLSKPSARLKIANGEFFSHCWSNLQGDLEAENRLGYVTDGRLVVRFREES